MVIDMNESRLNTVAQLRTFLEDSLEVAFCPLHNDPSATSSSGPKTRAGSQTSVIGDANLRNESDYVIRLGLSSAIRDTEAPRNPVIRPAGLKRICGAST